MKKLIILVIALCSITTICGQRKKVAVKPTIETVNEDIKGAVESTLQEGVPNSETYTISGQKKKIAVMPTIGTVNEDIKGAVESTLQEGVANSGTYTLVGRGEAFRQAMKEFDFQNTGAVDDNQLKDFGKAVGADYVCYASVYKLGINYRITYNMVDVASSEIPNVKSKSTSNGDGDLISVLDAIADDLFNVSRNRNTAQQQTNQNVQQQQTNTTQQQQTNANPVQQENQNVSQTSVARNGDVWNPDGIEMIYVEGGTFTMGATNEQGRDAESNEKPAHTVTLSSYYIGKYEVTQAQWKAIMGNNPSYLKGDNLPVETFSWNDAQEFIRRLNAQTGKNYRLPTEAEWEYAARGGKSSRGYKYSGSNNINDVAWYDSNSGKTTHPVGSKNANELGIYDMSGNVYEWCQDRYGKKYYNNSPQIEPQGPSSGYYRVFRGGSWARNAGYCRVSYRNNYGPDVRLINVGLRLVYSSKLIYSDPQVKDERSKSVNRK